MLPATGEKSALRLVPNTLSGLRLALAPAIFLCPTSWWLAILLTAGVSDWLDGWIARRYRVTSWMGGLLDGLADKAFTISVLVAFAIQGWLEPWHLPILMARDISVAAGVTVSLVRRDRDAFREMGSRRLGKLTTLLLFAMFVVRMGWPEGTSAFTVLLWLAALSSLAAGADYVYARSERITGR